MSTPLRIALAGLGTVGVGIVQIVHRHAALLEARAGQRLELVAVSARSRSKDRGVDISGYGWEDDPVALARRADVDLVIEVMGGEDGPALAVTQTALASGKHVVTANKAMLARHGQALAEQAEGAGATLRFEASVAGGIPIVKTLTEGLAANAVTQVSGVLNGTCNYILTEMETSGADYAEVLAEAQRLGYAEADPSFDVGGIDAAQKLAILTSIAFGTRVDFDGVKIEGIERVNLADIAQARLMGYSIKLLGVARHTDAGIEQRMQPCLVPETSAFGELSGVTNMVALEGDALGQTIHSGPGAGAGPTASAVMADVIDIARGSRFPAFGIPASDLRALPRAAEGVPAAYYLRFALQDAPGALARVATVLGENGISIDRMRQHAHESSTAPVLIVTHQTTRAPLDAALSAISAFDICDGAPVALRIEEI